MEGLEVEESWLLGLETSTSLLSSDKESEREKQATRSEVCVERIRSRN